MKNLNIKQIRDDVNLILWNNNLGTMENMKLTNELLEKMKETKIYIYE